MTGTDISEASVTADRGFVLLRETTEVGLGCWYSHVCLPTQDLSSNASKGGDFL
jgi:hypothetical protein